MERPPAKIDADSEDFAGLNSAYDFFDDEHPLESEIVAPSVRHDQKGAKLAMLDALKREEVKQILRTKPEPGVSLHIVSNGAFDYFSFVPVLVDLLGGSCDALYASSWTMNRNCVLQLFGLFDRGAIRKINMLVGKYFVRRESAVFATLLNGIRARGQRFRAFENHTKITLLSRPETGDFIVVEGSANWCSNVRAEQSVINNDRELFEFHRAWMDKYLNE